MHLMCEVHPTKYNYERNKHRSEPSEGLKDHLSDHVAPKNKILHSKMDFAATTERPDGLNCSRNSPPPLDSDHRPQSSYTSALIADLRANPLTGRLAPDFSQISLEEYSRIRIGGLSDRERTAREALRRAEADYFSRELWGPFSEALDEERWRRRMAHRAIMRALEDCCVREKDVHLEEAARAASLRSSEQHDSTFSPSPHPTGASSPTGNSSSSSSTVNGGDESIAAAEQKARLTIYSAWLTDYQRALPHQKRHARGAVAAAAAAHSSAAMEARVDVWARTAILDSLAAQEGLLREERRGRATIAWAALLEESILLPIDDDQPSAAAYGTHGELVLRGSRGGGLREWAMSRDDCARHFAANDSRPSEASALFAAAAAGRAAAVLIDDEEPFARGAVERSEAAARAACTVPYGSSRMIRLQEALGREGVEALEAFERHRGAIAAAARQMRYDVWWAGVKVEGAPRRWRGEDVGSVE